MQVKIYRRSNGRVLVLYINCCRDCKAQAVNILPPRQHGRRFADDIFKCVVLNGNVWIAIKISQNFVPKGRIDNNQGIGLDNVLAPNRRQAIIWTNADLIHWRIYAALGGDELFSDGVTLVKWASVKKNRL